MISSGLNLVMTVIGFGVSIMFIVFVCTRLICARIQLSLSRRSLARSDLNNLERGCHGIEPLSLANFPTKKYKELCLSSKENAWVCKMYIEGKKIKLHISASQRCTVCLADYHDEDVLSTLPVCGHSFHATCISIWLQQNSTCPVCRISLRDLPERKWTFMQPMFSSAVRSQYRMQSVNAHYCHCMANGNRRMPRNEMVQDVDVVRVGDSHSVPIGCEKIDRKVESASI